MNVELVFGFENDVFFELCIFFGVWIIGDIIVVLFDCNVVFVSCVLIFFEIFFVEFFCVV